MPALRIVTAIIAGAAGGAAAIGLMQRLLAYAAFPLMAVPFATSRSVPACSPPSRSSGTT